MPCGMTGGSGNPRGKRNERLAAALRENLSGARRKPRPLGQRRRTAGGARGKQKTDKAD